MLRYSPPVRAPRTRTNDLKKSIKEYDPSIQVVDNLADATHALVYAIPNTVADRPGTPLSVALNAETINVERIKEIENKVPTILTANMTSPWLIGEIEEAAPVTLAVFGVKAETLVDVIRGKFAPAGKLPFTIPANQDAITKTTGMFLVMMKNLPMYTVINMVKPMDLILV